MRSARICGPARRKRSGDFRRIAYIPGGGTTKSHVPTGPRLRPCCVFAGMLLSTFSTALRRYAARPSVFNLVLFCDLGSWPAAVTQPDVQHFVLAPPRPPSEMQKHAPEYRRVQPPHVLRTVHHAGQHRLVIFGRPAANSARNYGNTPAPPGHIVVPGHPVAHTPPRASATRSHRRRARGHGLPFLHHLEQ